MGARYHIRKNGEYDLSFIDWDDNEGWEVWTWGHAGNNPRKVESFDTQDEAGHALNMLAKYDLDEGTETPTYYDNKEDAIEELTTNDLED